MEALCFYFFRLLAGMHKRVDSPEGALLTSSKDAIGEAKPELGKGTNDDLPKLSKQPDYAA